MNAHALSVIELPRVLSLVADRASSALGAQRVRGLEPRRDRQWIEREASRVWAMRSLIEGEDGWRPEPIPDLATALARLRVVGAPWTGPELLGALVLLRSSRRTRAALEDEKRRGVATAVLAPFAQRLVSVPDVEQAIERAIGDDGIVLDEASPTLRRLRRDLRAAAGELIRLLERVMAKLEVHQAVPDMSVTVRNGRYVIPVRRDARGAVGGIVHDTSGTGATLFVEPPAAVEFGNRIREMEAEEAEEVDRILRELTERVRPHRQELLDALDALVELDTLYARAGFGRDFGCAPVDLARPGEGFVVREGRHPLLMAQGIPVVPFDLEMSAGERTLLLSGPNTGGKTVLLKVLGLLSAMVQSGVPVPVAAGSRVAIFDDIFADIGDEQSIEASLSTFSAHLRNLAEILRGATADSLALIDELGSGTDPAEGAALGGAILETLTARGTQTIATTHLGTLKQLATEREGIVNASLQFDPVALAPTYRLIKGIPGRSYGIGIARRLGLPEPVLVRAEERLPAGERDVAVLLADLEAREATLSERERELREMTEEAQQKTHFLAERDQTLRERERSFERESRKEARRYVLEARADIERTIRELRERGAEQLEEAARDARRAAERLAAEQGEAIDKLERSERRDGPSPAQAAAETIGTGDWVDVETLGGRRGRVVDLRDGEAVVAVGAMKLTVPLGTLRRSRTTPETSVALMGDLPEPEVQREIDLRGMRADEIDGWLLPALDAAIRADLRSLRIIHGKGTGALREKVAELLRKDVRVKSFRLGLWNEGGAGVTVAEL